MLIEEATLLHEAERMIVMKRRIVMLMTICCVCVMLASCGDSEMSKEELGDGLYPMYEKGSVEDIWGYIDKTGEYVIEPQFSYASEFSEGLAAVCDADTGLYGYIDNFGNWVIPPQFDSAQRFKNGYAMISQSFYQSSDNGNGWVWKEGYVMDDGEVIIPPKYDTAYDFDENGHAVVGVDRDSETYYTLIDGEGYESSDWCKAGSEESVDLLVDNWDFSQGPYLYPDVEKNLYGYVDENKEFVLEPDEKYDISSPGFFNEGMCAVFEEYPGGEEYYDENGYGGYIYGFMDTSGKMCTEMKFFSFMGTVEGRYENGAALVRTLPDEEGMVSYGYVDKKGKWLIKKEYSKELDERDIE